MVRPSILLCSVFGPFGIDDAFGRKENVMELLHNQVTREQGVFSPRFSAISFGLHVLAENVHSPVTVLDFPSERRFVRELREGYDFVGISFILPNFEKARRMAALVREHAPDSKIILGGHGTRIPDIEQRVEHDAICRGEGVRWLRELLGEAPDRPILHPVLPASLKRRVMGVPLAQDAAIVMPGVGCPNACRFCSTSHFFDKAYTPYLDTGAEMFDLCCRLEAELDVTEFFVLDENFLKRPERARELLALMERHDRAWSFYVFSSAETIADVGLDFLVRLGVTMVWVGVESEIDVFDKNVGIDFRALVQSLRDRGISVLASGILFLPHHDPATIWDDIRYVSGLGADYVQFMQLGPVPDTELYRDYERQGLIDHSVPYADWHGQKRIWFSHPSFSAADSERILRQAFELDYDEHGPSLMRLLDTTLRGYLHLRDTSDPFLKRRRDYFAASARHLRPLLPAALSHAHNDAARELIRTLTEAYAGVLGPMTWRERAMSVAVRALAAVEALRVRLGLAASQPPTVLTAWPEREPGAVSVPAGRAPSSADSTLSVA